MYHIRKTIRDTIKSYLIGDTSAGNNIFFDSPDVITPAQLPCVSIFSESETINYDLS